jgi:hydroxyethylthiazole kinase-like uncharacterized protein yjeF
MERSNSLHQPTGSLWLAGECQAFDQYLQSCGLPAASLMEQAARTISGFLISAAKQVESSSVIFLCGPGNNGADTIAAARQLLYHPHILPQIYLPGGPPTPEGLLSLQYQAYKNLGGLEIEDLNFVLQSSNRRPTVLVDGLFGVGLQRPVTGNYAAALTEAQKSGIPSLAVDCPSGLNCDNGQVLGTSLPASWTISFIGHKIGFQKDRGPHLCGEIQIADIGVRRELADRWLERHRAQASRS